MKGGPIPLELSIIAGTSSTFVVNLQGAHIVKTASDTPTPKEHEDSASAFSLVFLNPLSVG